MAMQHEVDKMQLRQNFRNLWHTDLLGTVRADTAYCCFALWCGPCVSYMLLKRALYNDMSRYECCAGYMPCSGRCRESKCPEICLGTEVFLCFANSVASTHFLLQDEFNIQTTKCDNCIIGFMFCLQQVACIFSIIAMIVGRGEIQEASQLLSCLANLVYSFLHKTLLVILINERRNTKSRWANEMVFGAVMGVPPIQQMSRIDQPIPPSIGYSQPGYGQPYGYPPPDNGHSQPG